MYIILKVLQIVVMEFKDGRTETGKSANKAEIYNLNPLRNLFVWILEHILCQKCLSSIIFDIVSKSLL